jgi:hypothetical protein
MKGNEDGLLGATEQPWVTAESIGRVLAVRASEETRLVNDRIRKRREVKARLKRGGIEDAASDSEDDGQDVDGLDKGIERLDFEVVRTRRAAVGRALPSWM